MFQSPFKRLAVIIGAVALSVMAVIFVVGSIAGTLLHTAVEANDYETAEVLLKIRANVNARGFGKTPYHMSADQHPLNTLPQGDKRWL